VVRVRTFRAAIECEIAIQYHFEVLSLLVLEDNKSSSRQLTPHGKQRIQNFMRKENTLELTPRMGVMEDVLQPIYIGKVNFKKRR